MCEVESYQLDNLKVGEIDVFLFSPTSIDQIYKTNFCCISKSMMKHSHGLDWKIGPPSFSNSYWKCVSVDPLIEYIYIYTPNHVHY
jgi:hypothetical protein